MTNGVKSIKAPPLIMPENEELQRALGEIDFLKKRVLELEERLDNQPPPFGRRFTNSLVSTNFQSGSSGWRIQENGDVEFNDGDFRGTVTIGDTSGDTNTNNIELTPSDGKITHYFEGEARTVLEGGELSLVNPTGTGGGTVAAALSAANNVSIGLGGSYLYQFDESGLFPNSSGLDLGSSLSQWEDFYLTGKAFIDQFGEGFTPDADDAYDIGSASLRWADVRSVLINGADIGLENGWKLREWPATKEDVGKPVEWMKENANLGIQILDDEENLVAVFHKNGSLYCNDVKPLNELIK